MPPIAAIPTTPNAGGDFASLPPCVAGERFSDTLMALLSPESLPGLSAADANALGWFALDAARDKDARPFERDADSVMPAAAEAAIPDALLFAGIAVPVVPMSTPEAFFSETGRGAAADALGTLGLSRAAGDRAEWQGTQLLREKLEAASESRTEALPGAHAATHVAAAKEAAATTTFQIDSPIGSAQFREQAADSLRWMARNGETHAEIQIHPAELGPIQIEMKLVGDRAELIFVAAHADTRDALQDQLPQLFDLLAESGIQLGDAQVRDDASPSPGFQARTGLADASGSDPDGTPQGSAPPRGASGDRLVDTFA